MRGAGRHLELGRGLERYGHAHGLKLAVEYVVEP